MVVTAVWSDGRCKKCGSRVIETTLDESDPDVHADYKNACSNESCEENHWHYVFDDDIPEYYEHRKVK